jgi:hypothetical protein
MKRLLSVAIVWLCFLFLTPAWGAEGRNGTRRQTDQAPRNDLLAQDSKCVSVEQKVPLAINVKFSRESGKTVTDQYGTSYNVWGYSAFEPKVYLPAYWGVFPLYFFGDNVGITVSVMNQSSTRKAKLVLRTECYCLNTDGSNGAKLMTPREFETIVGAGETKVVDASFCVGYTPDADSGLDRFLVKAYRSSVDGNDGEHAVGGEININPNNCTDNEFTLTLPDDTLITRDTLRGYEGAARRVLVKPKGNGNQNSLIVDGQAYQLLNADTYIIEGSPMTVKLYQAMSDGVAMGHWWIAINGGRLTITRIPDGQDSSKTKDSDLILMEEAIFCPPEFEGELWQAVSESVDQ